MEPVGIVSIVLGLFIVCSRGFMVMAPAASVRWLKRFIISSDGRIRTTGAFLVSLGAVTVWGGSAEDSDLAPILFVVGWYIVALSALLLVLFPGAYRALVLAFLPSDPGARLVGWQLMGLIGVIFGGFFIFAGARAL